MRRGGFGCLQRSVWCQDPKGGRRPINAKAESVSGSPCSGMPMLCGAASRPSMASSSEEQSEAWVESNPMPAQ
jgi:hypothetical protein